MVSTSHDPSSMPPWLPFYACQEGSAVARTILILKLHRLHTRPIIFPLQPALLPGSTARYMVPHPPVQTRNSSIVLDTSLLFSCKPLSPVNATSAGALEFTHLLPLLPPPESRRPPVSHPDYCISLLTGLPASLYSSPIHPAPSRRQNKSVRVNL